MRSFWVMCVTLALCACVVARPTIIVNFDDAPRENNIIFITVPRVNLVLRSYIGTIGFSNSQATTCEEEMPQNNCTLDFTGCDSTECILNSQYHVNGVTGDQTIKVIVTINDDYQVGCSPYVFPVRLNSTGNTEFECNPVFVNTSINETRAINWCRAQSADGEDCTPISNDPHITLGSSTSVENSTVTLTDGGMRYAAYYFPRISDSMNLTIEPILVTYQPIITSEPVQEFSMDLYINPSYPENLTLFCEINSFPTPNVTWRFASANNLVNNVTLNCLDPATNCILNSPTAISPNTYHSNLTIIDVTYVNAGIYSCYVGNDAFRADLLVVENGHARSYRVRVKDHLRPLWPAVGIVIVPVALVALMLVGTLWDKMIERYCNPNPSDKPQREKNKRMITSTSSDSPYDGIKHIGHKAVRRMSSARIQLLEEPGKN